MQVQPRVEVCFWGGGAVVVGLVPAVWKTFMRVKIGVKGRALLKHLRLAEHLLYNIYFIMIYNYIYIEVF